MNLWARTRLESCRTGVRCGPTWGVAFDVAAHATVPRLSFFFFFFITDSLQLGLIRADFHRTWPIRPESGHIGQIGSYRPAIKVVETNQNGRNKPKSVLNYAEIAEIRFEWGPNILNLSFLNFIMNICCFFCVFFFVLCLLPSSFFVLWIKA